MRQFTVRSKPLKLSVELEVPAIGAQTYPHTNKNKKLGSVSVDACSQPSERMKFETV